MKFFGFIMRRDRTRTFKLRDRGRGGGRERNYRIGGKRKRDLKRLKESKKDARRSGGRAGETRP